MFSDDFTSLEVSRYELSIKAQQPVSLPAFLGSTLRGAFGHALKDAVCVMAHRNCERCMIIDSCAYPYIFETSPPKDLTILRGQQHVPHPFILTPPIPDFIDIRLSQKTEKMPVPVRTFNLPDGGAVRLVQSRNTPNAKARRSLMIGNQVVFELLLLGRATEYMPYIVYAVSEMAKEGFGGRTRPIRVDRCSVDGRTGSFTKNILG